MYGHGYLVTIRGNDSLHVVIKSMVDSQTAWNAVLSFYENVMSQMETAEREQESSALTEEQDPWEDQTIYGFNIYQSSSYPNNTNLDVRYSRTWTLPVMVELNLLHFKWWAWDN